MVGIDDIMISGRTRSVLVSLASNVFVAVRGSDLILRLD